MSATTDYQFFFSHARVDRDVYLGRFCDDMAMEVQRLVPLSSKLRRRDIGFYDDESIDVGDTWSEELVNGLQTARTFVAVLTPGYINSENCGRELAVFLQRLQAGTHAAERRQARVLPLMWERPRNFTLPPVLEKFQWSHADLGDTYAKRGLRYLAYRAPNNSEYLDFISEFAAKLVDAARGTVLPTLNPVPRWARTTSAFSAAPEPAAAEPFGDEARNVPTARFAFVAGRKAEVAPLRHNVTAYAAEGLAWQPFAPSDPAMVGLTSQITAGREGYLFKTLDVDESLAERVRVAEDAGEIVVVVIDPWTVQLTSYRSCLRALDEGQFVNYGVLVPLNTSDPETLTQPDTLRGYVRHALSRTYVVNRAYIRDAIGTREEFERELVAAIADARRRMAQLNSVSVWNGAPPRPIPVVSGPGGP